MVSIVVPVYNVEKNIRYCLESLINQSYKNVEIILIDDGSTDRSSDICDEYDLKYNEVQVYHKVNGGIVRRTELRNEICFGQLYCIC